MPAQQAGDQVERAPVRFGDRPAARDGEIGVRAGEIEDEVDGLGSSSPGLRPGAQVHLEGPGDCVAGCAARRSSSRCRRASGWRRRPAGRWMSGTMERAKTPSIMPSTTTWATWMPLGPSSRASVWASCRRAALAPAKAEKPAPPRIEAVAPVNRIVPRPRGPMTRAASRPVKKPARAAISQTLVIDPRRGVGDVEPDVGADVEHHDLQRARSRPRSGRSGRSSRPRRGHRRRKAWAVPPSSRMDVRQRLQLIQMARPPGHADRPGPRARRPGRWPRRPRHRLR